MNDPTEKNCPHQEDGWCLDCVQKLAGTKPKADSMITIRLTKRLHEWIKEESLRRRMSMNRFCVNQFEEAKKKSKDQSKFFSKLPGKESN